MGQDNQSGDGQGQGQEGDAGGGTGEGGNDTAPQPSLEGTPHLVDFGKANPPWKGDTFIGIARRK